MKNIKLFSGSSHVTLAKNVSSKLNISLGRTEIFHFSNGETRVRILEDVKNQDCFFLQSLSTPTDIHWVETLFFLDALKRSGARKIIGVFPWLGYQKQDKQFRTGEAISVAVLIKTIETMGTDKIITINLHSDIIPTYFMISPVILSAFSLFLEHIKIMIQKNYGAYVLVAPDKEAGNWQKDFSKKLHIPFVQVTKERDKVTSLIPTSSFKIFGDVKGKTAIIIDDNIYTGSTLIQNAKLLKSYGAKRVICYVTHPILSGDSSKLIQDSEIDSLTVTDTIYIPPEKKFDKLQILSISSILSDAIKKIVW